MAAPKPRRAKAPAKKPPLADARAEYRPKEPAVLLARLTKRPKAMAWFPENWVVVCHQGESTQGWSLGPSSAQVACAFPYTKGDLIPKPSIGLIEMLAEDWYASYRDVRGTGWEFMLVFPKARKAFSFEP